MDTPRTESFFFHPRKNRASTPIDIPRPHQSPTSSAFLTSTRPLSPELIFEMEPFSPLDVSAPAPSAHRPLPPSFGLPTHTTSSDDREPLLYSFPVLSESTSYAHTGPDRLRIPPQNQNQCAALPSASLPHFPIAHNPGATATARGRATTLKTPRHPEAPPRRDPAHHAIRAVPVHKISGFDPDAGGAAASVPEARPPFRERKNSMPREPVSAPATLSRRRPPRPRRTSSRSSGSRSRRLPGYAHAHAHAHPYGEDRDVDSAEFAQFLRRRIESRKPLQFPSLHAAVGVLGLGVDVQVW